MIVTAPAPPRYATTRRGVDLLAIMAVLVLILATAPLLAVYSRITVYDVRVVKLESGGARIDVPTPRALARPSRLALDRPHHVVAELERRIDRAMTLESPFASTGGSYEWTIRWSANSARLDQSKVLTRTGGAPALR